MPATTLSVVQDPLLWCLPPGVGSHPQSPKVRLSAYQSLWRHSQQWQLAAEALHCLLKAVATWISARNGIVVPVPASPPLQEPELVLRVHRHLIPFNNRHTLPQVAANP